MRGEVRPPTAFTRGCLPVRPREHAMEAQHIRDEFLDGAVPSLTGHLTELRTAVPLVRLPGS